MKAVAVAAAPTPVRQGISNLMSRGAAGGAAKTVPETARTDGGTGGVGPKGSGGTAARKIQQAQRQQGRNQATHNAVKTIHKYLKDGDADRTPTRRSAPGGRRADINPGRGRLGRANERAPEKGG